MKRREHESASTRVERPIARDEASLARATTSVRANETSLARATVLVRSTLVALARPSMRAVPLLLALSLALCACSSSESFPPIPTTPSVLAPEQDAPGVVATITSFGGVHGSNTFFLPGDHVTVRFTLRKKDGSAWNLSEMSSATALVSGPTFNYQRVIAEQSDVAARAERVGADEFEYTFAAPLPNTYLPPLNDTPSFGAGDGELAGQTLLDGTYTIGLSFAWTYSIGAQTFLDVGETTADFLVGGSATLVHREVVKQENCERCHVSLQAHDGRRRNLTLCLCCHTTGAEDANIAAVESGTPGVTIQSRVLFHRIHDGAHLPSVVGVRVKTDGTLDYDAAPTPFRTVDSAGNVHDYSNAAFPAWPNRTIPFPKDTGYELLSPAAQAKHDQVHKGITSCYLCHGDPDGLGPYTEPHQGGIVYTEASRAACGACHDDVDWNRPYIVNSPASDGMPPQPNDAVCKECHSPTGATTLTVRGAHQHPLLDRTVNHGLDIAISNLAEGSGSNGDGTIDPGEKIAVTFTLKNDNGVAVPPLQLAALRAVISGPTSNSNIVLEVDIPKFALTGPQPFTINVPERLQLELVGHSTPALDTFTTARAPHLDVTGALTQVFARTGTSGGASTLAFAADELQNFVDVADATGFARNDVIVIDDGVPGEEEYLRIQFVDGSRLWFSSPETQTFSPGLRAAHAIGASVVAVTLVQKTKNVHYSLNAATGTITELVEFGAGDAVLVTYMAPFVMPSKYGLASNASPDLDETSGKWTGKSIVPGTYRLSLSAYRTFNFPQNLEVNVYNSVTPPAVRDFLVAGADALVPYSSISSGANCYACHQDIWFHNDGGDVGPMYHGFDTCIVCHAAAGSEDRPRYVAANAPETSGVTVNFRTLLHKVHMGKHLPDADPFTVVGAGPNPYPDNFTARTFAHVNFPATPGGTAQCTKCHGDTNTSWKEPLPRDHPSEQGFPVRVWRAACVTCHDATSTVAHADTYTSAAGVESCADCHGPGGTESVELVHKVH
jgi:hypothetical protein